MRTTVRLDDSLLIRAKKLAVEHKTTLTALIDEGLQYVLSLRAKRTAVPHRYTKLKVVKGAGVHEGITLNNNAALLDVMDERG